MAQQTPLPPLQNFSLFSLATLHIPGNFFHSITLYTTLGATITTFISSTYHTVQECMGRNRKLLCRRCKGSGCWHTELNFQDTCRLQHKWLLCAQQTLLKALQRICMVFWLTSSNWFVNQSNIWPTNGLFCWNKKWVLGFEGLSFLYQKSYKVLETNHWHKNICLELWAKLKIYTANGHMFK